MARVFQAELLGPAGFRKPVALKLLKSPQTPGQVGWTREGLVHEARLGGLLKHPNIVDIYELGEHEGCAFISMELVAGLSLRKILHERSAPPASVVLELALGLVAGLARAHAFQVDGRPAGLVHRDLKPSNILISWNGEVKIADFGIAVTRAGAEASEGENLRQAVGTPQYMSPEQLQRRPLDGRSDLFSLGLVLYELVIARRLLQAGELLQRLPTAVKERRSILVPGERAAIEAQLSGLGAIIGRCLQPLPQLRYRSSRSLAEALDSLREQVGYRPSLLRWLQGCFPEHSDGLASVISAPTPTLPDAELPTSRTSLEPHRARSNLGSPLDSFIGRSAELSALGEMVGCGARLITVKGTGGAGKTRLARRFARRSLDGALGGAWFVDLTESRTAMSIVHAVAQALSVPLSSDWELSGMVSRVGHAIAARGSMVVVLDNFEQILDQAPETVGVWLIMAPEAIFVVTTRERLRIGGEQVLDLEPLPESDGIHLFQMRAQAVGARWEDSPENRLALSQIVRGLDGIPLAIELAAARAVHLPPTALHTRLLARFDLLGGARRDHGDRQATLWGLIDWSWRLLCDWEQAALSQLSVFRDGFFLESAEAVLDLSAYPSAPWVLDVVSTLLDKSLLRSREVRGQPRFSMYLSVRDYAERQLSDQDAAGTTRGRHAAHFAQLGTEEALRALPRHGGGQRRRQLVVELDNCVTGAESALEHGLAEVAVGCALAAFTVFHASGPFAAGVALGSRVLGAPGLTKRDRVRVLAAQGELQLFAGQMASAESSIREALAVAGRLKEPALVGRVLNELGGLLRRQGQLEECQAVLEEGLKLGLEAKDWEVQNRARQSLAILRLEIDGAEHSQQAMLAEIRLARERGDRKSEALILGNMAIVHMELGHMARAESDYREALCVHRELGHRRLEGIVSGNLANLLKHQGRTDDALAVYEQALQGIRETGDRQAAANVLGNLGNLHRLEGRLEAAERCLVETTQIARDIGNPILLGVGLGNLADIWMDQGRPSRAREALLEAIEHCEKRLPPAAGAFQGSLAEIEAGLGNLERARALLDEGEGRLRGGSRVELGKFLCRRGQIALRVGDLDEAREALTEAEAIGQEIGTGPGSPLAVSLDRLKQALAETAADVK
jgi:predicted ATPase/serine/threonine protein kinase/tetratricopeptide (TPR) repeat protein